MLRYQSNSQVMVRPFASQRDGDTVTIGDTRRQVFLAIPAEGLDILDWLAEGRTVAETVELYEQRYAEVPDIDDFLALLAEEGFVGPAAEVEATIPADRSNLRWITPARARRLVGAPVLGLCGILVALATVLIAIDPGVVPGPTVLVFPHHLAALSLSLFAFSLAGVLVHELAHLVGARSAGVPARIGFSHRLWVIVAETDMTGIWLAPKRRRYLAFLAGAIVDAASASLLVGLLWAGRRGWLHLSPTWAQLAGAALFTYLMRLLWQCFLFVRTDFYYVAATALNCKSLLADTEDFLRNCWSRARRSGAAVDQSAIPAAEMRVVRLYSLIWVAGRMLALASLIFVTIPVLGRYGAETVRFVTGGHSKYGAIDILTIVVLALGLQGAGLVAWIRGLNRARTGRRTDELATS